MRGHLLTNEPEFLDPYWRGSTALALDLQYLQLAVEEHVADLDLLREQVLSKRRLDLVERIRSGAEEHSLEGGNTPRSYAEGAS